MFVEHSAGGNTPSAFTLIEVFLKVIYYCKHGGRSNLIKHSPEDSKYGSSKFLLWLKSAQGFVHSQKQKAASTMLDKPISHLLIAEESSQSETLCLKLGVLFCFVFLFSCLSPLEILAENELSQSL